MRADVSRRSTRARVVARGWGVVVASAVVNVVVLVPAARGDSGRRGRDVDGVGWVDRGYDATLAAGHVDRRRGESVFRRRKVLWRNQLVRRLPLVVLVLVGWQRQRVVVPAVYCWRGRGHGRRWLLLLGVKELLLLVVLLVVLLSLVLLLLLSSLLPLPVLLVLRRRAGWL